MNRLTEMHQTRFKEQKDNFNNFIIINTILENSEQYNLKMSFSIDNLNNSLTSV